MQESISKFYFESCGYAKFKLYFKTDIVLHSDLSVIVVFLCCVCTQETSYFNTENL